jgi:DNA-binding beta-propeller fold protein YncE
LKFTRTGQVALVIGKFNETGGSNDTTLMGRPSEVWVDPADNEAFVADGYGNRRIIVFDGATGRYLRHWGAYGKPPVDPPARGGGRGAAGGGAAAAPARGAATPPAGGATTPTGAALTPGQGRGQEPQVVPAHPPQQFSVPHGIAGSRDGLIYLADRANNRVQVFRQSGEFVAEKILRVRCGIQEQASWAPKRPCGTEAAFSIGLSHDRAQTYVYVADGGSHVITVLRRSTLEVVSEFGGPGVGPGQLGRPHNLSVDPSGNIFVAEAAGPQVKHPETGADVQAGFRAQRYRFVGVK